MAVSLETQRRFLQEMPPEAIPSGATLPISLMEKFLVPGQSPSLNLGCGTGKKALNQYEAGYTPLGFDVNAAAIEQARAYQEEVLGIGSPPFFFTEDVTSLNIDYKYSLFMLCEFFGSVIAEGLFCNLIGDDAEKAARIIDFYLQPNGFVFVADCLRCDSDYWRNRYERNVDADLPDGTFVVCKMGEYKDRENGDSETLGKLLTGEIEGFERLARHWRPKELQKLFLDLGFSLEEWALTIFPSRKMEPLPGCLMVLRKNEFFKYAMGAQGKALTPSSNPRVDFLQEDVRRVNQKLGGETILERWLDHLNELEEVFGFPLFGK